MGLDEQTKRQIRRAVQSLWQSSTPSGHARLSTGDHRLRVGDYRIVYGITGTHSVVFLIAHRREVYQRMRRR
jgi:mRNA-degrading endonuclease RelE of RelBE toxin-antitoxin system